MVSFLGPAEAVAISPFCSVEDIFSWAQVDSTTLSALSADAVWRQLLVSHFVSAFTHYRDLNEDQSPQLEKLAVQLPEATLRQVYITLQKVSSDSPFVLHPRSRLALEIHELREWDCHLKLFLMQQQAARLAEALGDLQALNLLRVDMAGPALELISLHTMMQSGRQIHMSNLDEVRWSQSAEADLRQLMDRRLQKRRIWWQKQREFLLQDLPEMRRRD